MNKQEIYELLKGKNIWHEITEHEEVYNMEDLSALELPYPEYDAKNIFVRDEKKINYYLITVKSEKRVDLKEFRRTYGTKNLSFAKEEDLMNLLGLKPGSVSPLGLLNDKEGKVQFYLDKEFTEKDALIGVHPNENTATLWLKTEDLIKLIEDNNHHVNVIEI
ncbi:MAG: prolyl-tRNA synthetase associated domain-containing protein [Bacilli bacterium]|nr:prolyl-tRNA synthetase associated domain-containing protein [Bacilli bacterium]